MVISPLMIFYFLLAFLVFSGTMASRYSRGIGVRTRGGQENAQNSPRYYRSDKNFFAALGELDSDKEQDGVVFLDSQMFNNRTDVDDDGFTYVRGKQSKRKKISSDGQSDQINLDLSQKEEFFVHGVDVSHFEHTKAEDKLLHIINKLAVNEGRVSSIQTKLDSILNLNFKDSRIETVLKSQHDRLKLLEYRSLDIEARSRRRNLLIKGIPEDRRENCFDLARHFISDELKIDRDMYLERAHRLGRFNLNKTRPIIVAFRDFCDVEEIVSASAQLRGKPYGVSRDYPNEIVKARQSLWSRFKSIRDNNPNKRVSFGYPAKISIDGSCVVDLFPEWYMYDVLQGSRISCNTPQFINESSSLIHGVTTGQYIPREQGVASVEHELISATLRKPDQTIHGQPTEIRMDTNEPPSPSLLNDNGPAPISKAFDNNVLGTKNIKPAQTRGRSSQRKAPSSARNRPQSSISQRRRSPTLTSTKGAQPRASSSQDPELASQQTKSTTVVPRSELVNRGRADRLVSRQRLTKKPPAPNSDDSSEQATKAPAEANLS